MEKRLEQKMQNFIDETDQKRGEFKTWQHRLANTVIKDIGFYRSWLATREENEVWRQILEKMIETKIQNFIDQTKQQRDSNKIWKQSLEDNLLKLISQNKVDATVLELKHKEKLKLWKSGWEQKI